MEGTSPLVFPLIAALGSHGFRIERSERQVTALPVAINHSCHSCLLPLWSSNGYLVVEKEQKSKEWMRCLKILLFPFFFYSSLSCLIRSLDEEKERIW